jgi:hypothetical protein
MKRCEYGLYMLVDKRYFLNMILRLSQEVLANLIHSMTRRVNRKKVNMAVGQMWLKNIVYNQGTYYDR